MRFINLLINARFFIIKHIWVFLFALGGHEIYVAVTNPIPTVQTCSDYLREPSDASWVRLDGCHFYLTRAVYGTNNFGKRTGKIYIPLYGKDADFAKRTSIVVETKDPRLVWLLDQLTTLETNNPTDYQDFIRNHYGEIRGKMSFEGRVRSFNLKSHDRREAPKQVAIGNIRKRLDSQITILSDGEVVNFSSGLFFLVFGGLWLGCIFLLGHESETKPGDANGSRQRNKTRRK